MGSGESFRGLAQGGRQKAFSPHFSPKIWKDGAFARPLRTGCVPLGDRAHELFRNL
jgi:hypothetical protein